MAESSKGAWIVAGAIIVAALIVVGGFYLLRDDDSVRVNPATTPTPTQTTASPSPATTPLSPEDAVRLLMVAWVRDDPEAALEYATPSAVQSLFREPRKYRTDFILTGCSPSDDKELCSLEFTQDARVSFVLHMVGNPSSGYKAEVAELFVV